MQPWIHIESKLKPISVWIPSPWAHLKSLQIVLGLLKGFESSADCHGEILCKIRTSQNTKGMWPKTVRGLGRHKIARILCKIHRGILVASITSGSFLIRKWQHRDFRQHPVTNQKSTEILCSRSEDCFNSRPWNCILSESLRQTKICRKHDLSLPAQLMIWKTFKNYPKISEDHLNHCESAGGKISPGQVLVIEARSQVQDTGSSMNSVPRNQSRKVIIAMENHYF